MEAARQLAGEMLLMGAAISAIGIVVIALASRRRGGSISGQVRRGNHARLDGLDRARRPDPSEINRQPRG